MGWNYSYSIMLSSMAAVGVYCVGSAPSANPFADQTSTEQRVVSPWSENAQSAFARPEAPFDPFNLDRPIVVRIDREQATNPQGAPAGNPHLPAVPGTNGGSTRQEILARLGQPLARGASDRVWHYDHVSVIFDGEYVAGWASTSGPDMATGGSRRAFEPQSLRRSAAPAPGRSARHVASGMSRVNPRIRTARVRSSDRVVGKDRYRSRARSFGSVKISQPNNNRVRRHMQANASSRRRAPRGSLTPANAYRSRVEGEIDRRFVGLNESRRTLRRSTR